MSSLEENLYTKKELKFKDGKFRILVISDTHGIKNFDRRLTRDIKAIVENTNPDLVLFNGDQIWKTDICNKETLFDFLSELVAVIEERKIPWAHTFGNHDAESGFEVEDQFEVYEKFEYCVSKRGDGDIHGTGNYVLPIKSSDGMKIAFNIWGLDSHRNIYQFVEEGGIKYDDWHVMVSDPLFPCAKYDTVRFDQIMWYWNTSKQLEEYNKEKIPGLMYFHIAIPEFALLYKNVAETTYRGNRREAMGCGPVNTGLFATAYQRGDVKTIICGHDHLNDYQGEYLGITMAYDAGLNYDCYVDDDMRGARIVDIDENNTWKVKTYMVRSVDYVKDYPGNEIRR